MRSVAGRCGRRFPPITRRGCATPTFMPVMRASCPASNIAQAPSKKGRPTMSRGLTSPCARAWPGWCARRSPFPKSSSPTSNHSLSSSFTTTNGQPCAISKRTLYHPKLDHYQQARIANYHLWDRRTCDTLKECSLKHKSPRSAMPDRSAPTPDKIAAIASNVAMQGIFRQKSPNF